MPRFCDIIMKGGITSGIVYPAAVFEIAQSFTFKNVGGTSAGAIAAALTAAAERRRCRSRSMDGFLRVNDVPNYLSLNDHLYKLFTPTRSTKSLYRTIVSLFGRPRFKPAFVAKWAGLVWAYPVSSIIGALCGCLFLATVLGAHRLAIVYIIDIAAAAITIVVGITVAIGVALARDILRRLPRNNYGLVKGVDDSNRANLDALCTWLTRELELTAGLNPDVVPLTFGMLWDANRDVHLEGLESKPSDPDVNLAMITTNVTWGRPYEFPNDVIFYYDPDELLAYFPDHVIAWMKLRPRKPRNDSDCRHFATYAEQNKLPLPSAADLPVIVATRISLAFPILLSAVPLYAADWSTLNPGDPPPPLQQCWFSDGGISSNFPVTLFDSPLPRWPTFAINLGSFSKTHPETPNDEAENVHMPSSNGGGILSSFSKITGLSSFLSSIVNVMQNWNDNTQTHLPGYRDRIVTVSLNDDEGGLNLDMPAGVLRKLRLRGAAAGRLIVEHFREPSQLDPSKVGMNWENHRWLRYRSTMGAIKSYLTAFKRSYDNPESPDVSYGALIAATAGTPIRHYPISGSARARVAAATECIVSIGGVIEQLDTLDDALPKPPPYLTQRASLDT